MIAEDGGAAFPTTQYSDQKPFGIVVGMTLRDYFAAHALTGFLSGPSDSQAACEARSDAMAAADWSYQHADAMLKARTE